MGRRCRFEADRIVAVVNDEVLTFYDLRTRLDTALSQLKQQGTPLPPREVLERQMLERLVVDRIQLQMARDAGLRIDDAQRPGAQPDCLRQQDESRAVPPGA